MAKLEVRALTLQYGKSTALEAVSFSAKEGEKISLVGPNGSGKSSLVKALVGSVSVIEHSIEHTFSTVGYVPQKFKPLEDHLLTVREFLNLTQSSSISAELIELLQLEALMNLQLRKLSGGQLQRVLIAFALFKKPTLVLLDEYIEGLDARFQDAICHYIDHYAVNNHALVIEVTHDLNRVTLHDERVILLNKKLLFDGKSSDPRYREHFSTLYPHHKSVNHD